MDRQHALQLLQHQLEAAIAEPLCVSADAPAEANGNVFYLRLDAAAVQYLTIGDLQNWLDQVVAAKREQLRQHQAGPPAMRFYCWVDAMAGQLRYSLITSAEGRALPFGCTVRLASQLTVIREYLSLDTPGMMPWEELTDTEPEPPAAPYVLNVWATLIA